MSLLLPGRLVRRETSVTFLLCRKSEAQWCLTRPACWSVRALSVPQALDLSQAIRAGARQLFIRLDWHKGSVASVESAAVPGALLVRLPKLRAQTDCRPGQGTSWAEFWVVTCSCEWFAPGLPSVARPWEGDEGVVRRAGRGGRQAGGRGLSLSWEIDESAQAGVSAGLPPAGAPLRPTLLWAGGAVLSSWCSCG